MDNRRDAASYHPGKFLFKCLRVQIVIEWILIRIKMNTWTVFSSLFMFRPKLFSSSTSNWTENDLLQICIWCFISVFYDSYAFTGIDEIFKGIVPQKRKILSLITHPHVVSNPLDLHSSSEHKLRYLRWNPRAFWCCIDSNTTSRLRFKKVVRTSLKIVHVTSVVQ